VEKQKFGTEGALTFQQLDFIKIAILGITKQYLLLADHLVPMGDQIGMSKVELAKMLQRKMKMFTEDEIREKWPQKGL
jgi:hypothetical protein